MRPAPAPILRNTFPFFPQVHTVSGASFMDWNTSNSLPHFLQEYSYVGMIFGKAGAYGAGPGKKQCASAGPCREARPVQHLESPLSPCCKAPPAACCIVLPAQLLLRLSIAVSGVRACRKLLLYYTKSMTETLTIRLPRELARELRAKTRAARTNPTAVLRQAALNYVQTDPAARNAVVSHLRARAGTWDGAVTGVELLKKTRP